MRKHFLPFLLCLMVCFIAIPFSACNEVTVYHMVLARSSALNNAGSTSGSGNYPTNTEVTLVATPKENHEFLAWTKDYLVISYEPTYKFIVNSSTEGEYVALFSTDKLEFAMLDNIEYEINDILYENENVTPKKILSWELKYNKISALYKDLAKIENIDIPSSYSYSNDAISPIKKVFFIDNKYYFSLTIRYESYNSENSTSGEEIITSNFVIDFDNIASISGVDKTYTAPDGSYKLEQTSEEENSYSLTAYVYSLSIPTAWSQEKKYNTQQLKLHFTYPFIENNA